MKTNDLINIIPKGKKNKVDRKYLILKAGIKNAKTFQEILKELRKKYIVIFDEGYFLPETKEEYQELINRLNKQICSLNETLRLAHKEMEGGKLNEK